MIDAMALCPCCLKGAHGKAAAVRELIERGVDRDRERRVGAGVARLAEIEERAESERCVGRRARGVLPQGRARQGGGGGTSAAEDAGNHSLMVASILPPGGGKVGGGEERRAVRSAGRDAAGDLRARDRGCGGRWRCALACGRLDGSRDALAKEPLHHRAKVGSGQGRAGCGSVPGVRMTAVSSLALR